MTFIVRQIALKADGSEIVRETTPEGAEMTIGRNSDNAIHLPDLAVNPVHASIRRNGDDSIIVEAVSGQPFQVDGIDVTTATVKLARGAELGFGGHRIAVGLDADGAAVTLTVRRTDAVADSEEEKDEREIYSLIGKLPGKRGSAWGFVALVVIACLAWPVYTWATYRDLAYNEDVKRPDGVHGDGFWSSGSLSLAHNSLKDDCQACHVDAFVSVRDKACMTCHDDDAHDHAPKPRLASARGELQGFAAFRRAVASAFNKPQGRCVECHTEHESAGAMQPTVQRFCAECHDGLDSRLTDTTLLNAADFGKAHPQFRPAVLINAVEGDDPEKAPRRRISLDRKPSEDNGLKFPHDLHLDRTGGVAQMGRRLSAKYGFGDALDCADCHTPDPNGVRFEPVDMEENCAMCHSLSYDEIDGTFRQLPHGKPDLVKADLRAYYRSTGPNRPINLGSLPRQRPGTVNRQRTAADYARAVRFRPTRANQAIRAVFSEGGACYDCHSVNALGGLNYSIDPVTQTDRYMHKGWFSHAAHEEEDCTDCHKATTSKQATDLLLPGIATCRECHGGEASDTDVPSTCALCHEYHADGGAPWLVRQQNKDKQRREKRKQSEKPKIVARR
ncbi:cytochrome c3 family protein [Alterisphingorhabdus coralli]|uniref:Cytochrome c3 family protein n=1 Tax=Alterisphingorhabdus coralli TaxID=3071408 RepID=A0AA97F893_9SPHN|nr:cytochrome c3 family protein [Parasphingorhabdus sp. SCSIO 66989]WOE76164.1 cytochrome c3 family protein [Parasphingorhabdus sp. SCSIO 66989]